MTISFLGDSLLDTGNLTNILAPFGLLPFPDPPYSGGKASNGLVLGQAIIDQLGIAPETLLPGFRLPTASITFNPLVDNINYAVAGATTGASGSAGNELQLLPVGLQTQVLLLKQDIAAASAAPAGVEKPDIIISAGSNDVFETLVDIETFANILLTPEKDDDNALRNDLATQVVGNIDQAIESLATIVGNVVIFGLPRLGDTPFSIQIDAVVDELLPGDFAGQTRDFLTSTAAEINGRLIDQYNDSGHPEDCLFQNVASFIVDNADEVVAGLDNLIGEAINLGSTLLGGGKFSPKFGGIAEGFVSQVRDLVTDFSQEIEDDLIAACSCDEASGILVIDGISVFDQGLDTWIESLPENLTPITELSYRDYLTQLAQGNPNGLPADLVVDQFAFIDGSHPTSNLVRALAGQAAPLIAAEFPTFGR